MSVPIEELELSVNMHSILKFAGIDTVAVVKKEYSDGNLTGILTEKGVTALMNAVNDYESKHSADITDKYKAEIEELKSERNRICKQLKKLRQKLNAAERRKGAPNDTRG